MGRQNDSGTLAFVELLSIGEGVLKYADRSAETPIVLFTVRPEPDTNWQSFTFAVSREQAERLRDDLTSLLEKPQSPTLLN
jgi:hypothetical protein